MTIIRIQTLAILFLLFVTACAKSSTRLGREINNREDGGALSDDDPQSESTSSSSGAASSSDDGPTATVQEKDSGLDGFRITNPMDAGVNDDFSNSNPPVPPIQEDPEDRQARLDLISEYCSLLEKYPCLESYYSDFEFGTMEERVRYCELDLEFNHYQFVSDPAGIFCESEWKAVLECAIEHDYSCPCTEGECFLAHANLISPDFPYPCREEERAINDCRNPIYVNQGQMFDITGERLRCVGYLNPLEDAVCTVACWPDKINILLECYGPQEGPFDCTCLLYGEPLYDAYEHFYDEESPLRKPEEMIPDCESATRATADGMCRDIADCCFTWVDEDEGNDGCGCTADPTRSSTGAETCEELAAALGGEVVEHCPQHDGFEWMEPPR